MRRITRKVRRKRKQIIIISSICLLLCLCVGYAAFGTQLSIRAKGNIKEYEIDNYIVDGLFAMYDGIENTADGHGVPIDNWYNKALDLNPTIASTAKSTLINFMANNWTDDNGLLFNGVDNMVDTGYLQEELGQEITLSFVVYTTSVDSYYGYFGYHQGPSVNKGMSMQFNSTDGGAFSYYGESSNCGVHVDKTITDEKILNKKVNITAILSAKNRIALYLNGEKIDDNECTIAFEPYPNSNFIIGKTYEPSTTTKRYFQGTMYNFMVYKRVLTDEEISKNYKVNKARYDLGE